MHLSLPKPRTVLSLPLGRVAWPEGAGPLQDEDEP